MSKEEIIAYFKNKEEEIKAEMENTRYENMENDKLELIAIRDLLKLLEA